MPRMNSYLVSLFFLLAILGCSRHFPGGFGVGSPGIFVEIYQSTKENPYEICGDTDLGYLLRLVRCNNGDWLYESVADGLKNKDEAFSHSLPNGKKVLRFTGKCVKKEVEFFVTVEACDNIEQYQEYPEDELFLN